LVSSQFVSEDCDGGGERDLADQVACECDIHKDNSAPLQQEFVAQVGAAKIQPN